MKRDSQIALVREQLALAGPPARRRHRWSRRLRVAALLAALAIPVAGEELPSFQQVWLPGLAGFDVGDARSTPSLADIDGDGDLDVVAGDYLGKLRLFRNTGSTSAPAFAGLTGSGNPFEGLDVDYLSAPVFADLDGDGDLDAVVGSYCPPRTFANTGSATAPSYVELTGTDNPFSFLASCGIGLVALGDLDGDGDLDAALGNVFGLRYLDNTGSSLLAAFVELTGSANPFAPIVTDDQSAPALVDLDGDGDLDVVVGEGSGNLRYLRNTGSSTAPLYVELTGTANPLSGFSLGTYATPTLGDLDGDGDLDVVAGESFGTLRYLRNNGSSTAPAFVTPAGTANPVFGADVGRASAPAVGDLDGDGDLDAVVGERYGTLFYFTNTGSSSAPVYTVQTGSANPLSGIDVGSGSTPVLADVDGDGDLDAVIGGGELRYFRNTGSSSSPAFVEQSGGANPFDGIGYGLSTAAALVDLDADGDLDVVLGGYDYYSNPLRYFVNTGSSSAPVYVERTGSQNPFDGVLTFNVAPALGDLDGDGDFDLVIGWNPVAGFSSWRTYENTGSAVAPAFVQRTGSANPLAGFDASYQLAPTLADLDGDGDIDVLAGEDGGSLSFFASQMTVFADGFESGDTSAWSQTVP